MIGDKQIKIKGKSYRLATTRDAKSYDNMEATRRKAQRWVGDKGKVRKIHNTYMFAVYEPVQYKFTGELKGYNYRTLRKNKSK